MEHPELGLFDNSWIPRDGRFYCFVGPHGSGKSTLMRYFASIVDSELGVEDWMGYSDTEGGNGFLSTLIHKPFINECVPSDADIEYIYQTRKAMVSRELLRNRTPRRLGIVIDDCDDENDVFRKCKVFRKMISNMRHLRVFVLIAVQNISQLPPGVRSQIDFLFQLRAEGPEAVDDVYKRYLKGRLGIAGHKYRVPAEMDRLRVYLQRYTQTGTCLVISKAIGASYLSYMQWPASFESKRLGDEVCARVAQQIAASQDVTPEEQEKQYQLQIKRLREERFKER
jgi:energy-coupling factor transporter ATP-binding protein EcfA2